MSKSRFARVLQSQYAATCRDNNPYLIPYMKEDEINVWYFLACNMPHPYENGEYIFRLDIPPEFPQKPPKFSFVTPNGVYEPGGPICISIGEFHAKDRPGKDGSHGWRPALGIRGFAREVVNGMLVSSNLKGGIRILVTSNFDKTLIAKQSAAFNKKNHPKLLEAFKNFEEGHPSNRAVVQRQMWRAVAEVCKDPHGDAILKSPRSGILQKAFGDELWQLAKLNTGVINKILVSYVVETLKCRDPPIRKALALMLGAFVEKEYVSLLEFLPNVCGSLGKVVPPIVAVHCKTGTFQEIYHPLFEYLATQDIDLKNKRGNDFAKKYAKSLGGYSSSEDTTHSETKPSGKDEAPATKPSVKDAPAKSPPSMKDVSAKSPPSVKDVSAKSPPSVKDAPAKSPPSVKDAPATKPPVKDAPATKPPVKEAPAKLPSSVSLTIEDMFEVFGLE